MAPRIFTENGPNSSMEKTFLFEARCESVFVILASFSR